MEDYQTVILAAGAAIALIVAVAIVVAVIRRRRQAAAMQAPLPLIPFSAGQGSAFGPPRPDRAGASTAPPSYDRTPAPTPGWSAPVSQGVSSPHARSPYAPPVSPEPPRSAVASGSGASNPPIATPLPNDSIDGTPVDGASVRYWRPADGTLQFLPGRLEVIAGRDSGQEIRFVRTPGPDGTRVTFGRAEGAPYRHVQLREPTVSRTHARMTLEAVAANGPDSAAGSPCWRLENLSATNPVVVNGRPLASDDSEHSSVMLDEGDRIEMGEVIFRFHTR